MHSQPAHRIRFVTAAALFDGHDASINIFRRLLQARGVEVIHLGHNRSAEEVVIAAIQEDVQGIAISSYQGGHNEYFRYVVDMLRERGAGHIQVFGGGGGVIVQREIESLEDYGVARIYSPADGRALTLEGIIDDMIRRTDFQVADQLLDIGVCGHLALARSITRTELGLFDPVQADDDCPTRVLGITGTGGAGKSSLTDELIRRLVLDSPDTRVAVVSIDPSRRKTGGALLGDRIRMNAINHPNVFMRSLATRDSGSEISGATKGVLDLLKSQGFDLVIVETSGIGQGASAVADLADLSLYVMTPEYGAASQLEKIDMLDFADVVAINKFDRGGAEDALRDVRKQFRRNHNLDLQHHPEDQLPVFGTIPSQFGDRGVDALYLHLLDRFKRLDMRFPQSHLRVGVGKVSGTRQPLISERRARYLGDIADLVRDANRKAREKAALASRMYQLDGAMQEMEEEDIKAKLQARLEQLRDQQDASDSALIAEWPELRARYQAPEMVFQVRNREIKTPTGVSTLSGNRISRVALPNLRDWGDILYFRLQENLPGYYPYTAGVFPFRRTDEAPKRQFAGEGGPARTNARFHLLSKNDDAKRLSTAFDSVTLYGQDPDERPDIFGKIGEGGVSIATLDDLKMLYRGFDLCAPNTSVSMTINGPAPMLLAMFFNAAIDQQMEAFVSSKGRAPTAEEQAVLADHALSVVRGTVQADILKEDQAQNTCIFSTEFALRLMGDMQQFFIDKSVKNFYSVSISGYHIAEAGANPITQLAFTLANGFTFVEYYLSRGMEIDDFAHNLSFFFSNGLDPEYAVMGRVARRIWARVMKIRYGASERSQKFKYHIQTSGRSLHAQEIQFNDIRTTLQALTAIYDNCNSLHTNAYDEAITTPTAESVRRAMAIQMIIGQEFGMAFNENPLQGSYIIDELTDLVEEAVMLEFERLNSRGGVLGAMERQYHRSRIQEESLHYELKKDSGALPIIGVNTFLAETGAEVLPEVELARATDEEKYDQIHRLRDFQTRHAGEAASALQSLREVARTPGANIFAELMKTVRVASLGQISEALFDVGGQYRRSM
jgi:methylmalonyl-CoA mutase